MLLERTMPIIRTNVALLGRDPGPLIGRITQPCLLVLLLRPLYVSAMDDRSQGTVQVVLGQLVMFSLLGMSIVGTSILTERRWCTFDRLRATPARTHELLVGKAIPVLVFLLLQQVVVLALGVVVLDLHVHDYRLLLFAELVWAVTVLCMGAAIAMSVNSLAQFSAVIDIGATILAGLSGALVPMSAMPAWAHVSAPIWPGYWAMNSLRGAVNGDVHTTVVSSAVLAAMAALAITIASHRLGKGWGRNTLL
jgi:ABC-2 type transport system permease protein